jgi:hypothetical protein
MKTRRYRPVIMALGIMLALTMTGCATTPSGSAKSPRELMLKAGYQQNVADQPEEIKHFQKLPAGKMLCYVRGDQKCYAYKDVNTNSMYVGDEAAFKRYVDRIVQERMDQSYQQPTMQPDDPQFWNIWVDKQGGG